MSDKMDKISEFVWGKDDPIAKEGIEIRRNGTVFMDGQKVPEDLSNRLTYLIQNKLPTDALKKFLVKLYKNPNKESREYLYRFLQHNGHPITKEGNFIAYKKITGDFKDCYTSTLDNRVGATVKMDRADVNRDPKETCSHGLHVASWGYLSSYSGAVIVEVEVDPEHVVCVPVDYNNTKMRVCQYKVLSTTTAARKEDVITEDAKKRMPKPKKKKASLLKAKPKAKAKPTKEKKPTKKNTLKKEKAQKKPAVKAKPKKKPVVIKTKPKAKAKPKVKKPAKKIKPKKRGSSKRH